ncbi:hypothetical protein FDP41_008157 [Naegleria fowleri]|uniref:Uncharacterized protein n=1 Tax=Naegleria fowleri TaxID=5763 RepID=A0A6A5B332_NAEFO|nr:uncharacterized protein FDP41_008157 [Naegleria fowleri]KAF0973453.1 hypothetical protein FDP41_008157 [Naegleria fowleri]CAG4712616.1 unnamed protein product [Naegleria fowleri]
MFKSNNTLNTKQKPSTSTPSSKQSNSEAAKIMNIISSQSSIPPSTSFSFQTHHVQYCYPISKNKKNQYIPTVKITKLHEKKQSLICTQDELKQMHNNEQVLNVLNDIFNEKLITKYNGNVDEYKRNEKERHSIKNDTSIEGTDVQLFDDVPMESLNEQEEDLKKKALQDLMDEGVDSIMDQYKLPKISIFGEEEYSSDSDEESKISKKSKKKRSKEFAFLEDSDEEIEENLAKEINVATEDESEEANVAADEELLKSKAQETQGYLKYSKVKKDKVIRPGSKKRKANAEYEKIKNLMKEKEDQKKDVVDQNKSKVHEKD